MQHNSGLPHCYLSLTTRFHFEQEEAKGIAAAWEKDMAAALERAELDPATRRWSSRCFAPSTTLPPHGKARTTLGALRFAAQASVASCGFCNSRRSPQLHLLPGLLV